MFIANALSWSIGGVFVRSLGVMVRIPKHILLPIVLLDSFFPFGSPTATTFMIASIAVILLAARRKQGTP